MMTKFPINGSRVGYVDEAWQDVDEDDDVGDPVNSDVAADDNDEILVVGQPWRQIIGGELMLLPNSSKPKYLKLLK